MASKSWPALKDFTLAGVIKALEYMIRTRDEDVSDFDQLPERFMAGRKVGKVPTGSADVLTTDRAGDFNYSAAYLYLCVENAGNVVWRRIALSSW